MGVPVCSEMGAETRVQLADSGQLGSPSRPQFPCLCSEEVDFKNKNKNKKHKKLSIQLQRSAGLPVWQRGPLMESTALNHVQTTGMWVYKAGTLVGSPAAGRQLGAPLPPLVGSSIPSVTCPWGSLAWSSLLCLNYTFTPGFKWGCVTSSPRRGTYVPSRPGPPKWPL